MVYVESPYGAKTDFGVSENELYARECVADCIAHGENPYASHLFFTQPGILNDRVPEDRELGMTLGFAWAALCEASVFYIDRGWSPGMVEGYKNAKACGRPVLIRSIKGNPLTVPL